MAAIEAISTTYLEADAASVTFSSIPATYEHLQLRCSGRTDYSTTNSYDSVYLRFNSDSTASYADHQMYAVQTTTGASGSTSQTGISKPFMFASVAPDSAMYGPVVCDILDYANGSKYTTVRGTANPANLNTSTGYVVFASGLWLSTTAVNAITLISLTSSDLVRGSEFTLYGLNSS